MADDQLVQIGDGSSRQDDACHPLQLVQGDRLAAARLLHTLERAGGAVQERRDVRRVGVVADLTGAGSAPRPLGGVSS